jgi:predicted dehydrogenase
MLADQQLDLVSIVTPPYLHHEMTLAALERGCHVLCEKPFALNLAQAREMLAAARQAGVVHAVDHEFRYLPARLKMKELVESGYLGELLTVRISAQSDMLLDPQARPWTWWHDREKGGGILGALGSHLIDTLRWWFGEIVELAAQLDTYVKRRPLSDGGEWREVTADDLVAALLRLANGAQASFLVSGLARGAGSRMEAHGTAGTLIIDEATLLGVQGRGAPQPIELPALPRLNQGDDFRIAPFLSFLERFLPQLRGEGEAAVASFEEGVAVQAVMDAMHESSQTGSFVKVERVDPS